MSDSVQSCRIGVISWPMVNKTPEKGFVSLGEIYDKNIRENRHLLSLLHEELSYLYPFRCCSRDGTILIHNMEDFDFYRNKYKLTPCVKCIGLEDETTKVFHTPVLYDLDCMVPVFGAYRRPFVADIISSNKVCIVLPYADPIARGRLIDRALESNFAMFVVVGDVCGRNRDTIATLTARCLLCRGATSESIIKYKDNKIPQCILSVIALLRLIDVYDTCQISIACLIEDMNIVSRAIRSWKSVKTIEKSRRFNFLCPY